MAPLLRRGGHRSSVYRGSFEGTGSGMNRSAPEKVCIVEPLFCCRRNIFKNVNVHFENKDANLSVSHELL